MRSLDWSNSFDPMWFERVWFRPKSRITVHKSINCVYMCEINNEEVHSIRAFVLLLFLVVVVAKNRRFFVKINRISLSFPFFIMGALFNTWYISGPLNGTAIIRNNKPHWRQYIFHSSYFCISLYSHLFLIFIQTSSFLPTISVLFVFLTFPFFIFLQILLFEMHRFTFELFFRNLFRFELFHMLRKIENIFFLHLITDYFTIHKRNDWLHSNKMGLFSFCRFFVTLQSITVSKFIILATNIPFTLSKCCCRSSCSWIKSGIAWITKQ